LVNTQKKKWFWAVQGLNIFFLVCQIFCLKKSDYPWFLFSLESVTSREAPQGTGSDWNNLPGTAHTDRQTDTVALIYKMLSTKVEYMVTSQTTRQAMCISSFFWDYWSTIDEACLNLNEIITIFYMNILIFHGSFFLFF
jgi:hypothetical protein